MLRVLQELREHRRSTGSTVVEEDVKKSEDPYVPGLQDLPYLCLGIWCSVATALKNHALSGKCSFLGAQVRCSSDLRNVW